MIVSSVVRDLLMEVKRIRRGIEVTAIHLTPRLYDKLLDESDEDKSPGERAMLRGLPNVFNGVDIFRRLHDSESIKIYAKFGRKYYTVKRTF